MLTPSSEETSMTKLTITSTYTDDHLPCVDFDYGDNGYSLCWTDHALIARLEAVQDGEMSLKVACKKYPILAEILNNPLAEKFNEDGQEIIPERDEERQDEIQYFISCGCLTCFLPEKKVTKKKVAKKGKKS